MAFCNCTAVRFDFAGLQNVNFSESLLPMASFTDPRRDEKNQTLVSTDYMIKKFELHRLGVSVDNAPDDPRGEEGTRLGGALFVNSATHGTNFINVDLSWCRGLTQAQINEAMVSRVATILPEHLSMPAHASP